VSLPRAVRDEIRERVWTEADQIGWINLSLSEKAKRYEHWTKHTDIGALLARYMDRGQIRVYLKDTVLKGYSRRTLARDGRPLRILGIDSQAAVVEHFAKPNGVRLNDGRIVAWGRAEDWKLVLMAMYERSSASAGTTSHAAVLMGAVGRFNDPSIRAMIEEAARRLGIGQVKWLAT
jgi:hypothetical protein